MKPNRTKNCLGSADAVAFHLRGLIRIKEVQFRDGSLRSMGLLQRMILMYVSRRRGEIDQMLI